MSFDYRKLKGKIVEVCGTQTEFANKMGISEHTVSRKLNNNISWSQDEMAKAMEIFGLDNSHIHEYFFTN